MLISFLKYYHVDVTNNATMTIVVYSFSLFYRRGSCRAVRSKDEEDIIPNLLPQSCNFLFSCLYLLEVFSHLLLLLLLLLTPYNVQVMHEKMSQSYLLFFFPTINTKLPPLIFLLMSNVVRRTK